MKLLVGYRVRIGNLSRSVQTCLARWEETGTGRGGFDYICVSSRDEEVEYVSSPFRRRGTE